jgi:hypothetical protein
MLLNSPAPPRAVRDPPRRRAPQRPHFRHQPWSHRGGGPRREVRPQILTGAGLVAAAGCLRCSSRTTAGSSSPRSRPKHGAQGARRTGFLRRCVLRFTSNTLIGQHDQDRGDSVDGEALDSVDDEEVRDELIPPLLRFQCHCCRRSILWMTRRHRTTSPSAVVPAISMTRNRRASCTSTPIFAVDPCSLSNALLLPSPQC